MYESTFYATRQPLLPLNKLLKFYDIVRHHHNKYVLEYLIKEFSSNFRLEEALYLASDVLYNELIKYRSNPLKFSDKEKNRMLHSLTKYYIRASARATPFGLFGNFREGSFDVVENINDTNILRYHPKLDMEVLYQISEYISNINGIKNHLTLRNNTSLYKTKDDFRYVEYRITNGFRSHHLVSVKCDNLLNFIIKISKKGIGYDALITELLNNYDVDKKDIERYVDHLISCKLLITNLDINITGKDYFEILSDFISKISVKVANEKILNVNSILQEINSLLLQINNEQSNINSYKKIHELLKQLLPNIPEKNLIQLDVTSKEKDYTLPLEIKANLNNLLYIFSAFSKSYSTEIFQLEIFKRAFYERYENRMMKLTEVFDEELGIGYKSAISIKDMYNSKKTDKNKFTSFVQKKYHQYLKNQEKYIELNDANIKEHFGNTTNNIQNVNPGFTYLLNAYPKEGESLFHIVSYSPSMTGLSGRFCNLHKEYYEKLNDLVKSIESQDGDYIYAEITHLPQARVGNVIGRPYFGEYEIPFLSTSLLPDDKKIMVDDLYIQIIDNELYLFSKNLTKPIRPRLSNAHNYKKDGLPIYHFLSDMQYQNFDADIIWDWRIIEDTAEYFPRVVYKNIIVQQAYWIIKDENFVNLKKAQTLADFKKKMFEVKQKLNFEDWVVFKERDNVLYLDLSTDLGLELIQKYVNQNDKQIILYENLIDNKHDLSDSKFNNELVVPFINLNRKITSSLKRKISKGTVKRTFIPGSEWIYFKIYIEHKFSNKLLVILGDYIEKKLINKGLIEKWFFIRYSDPKQHIRLRLNIKDLSKLSTVIEGISNIFSKYEKSGKISSVVQETYQRELERYGDKNIIRSEALFYEDSKLIYEIYKSLNVVSYRQLFFASYLIIEKYLETLGTDNFEKLRFLSENFNYFAKEFNYENDKVVRNSLHDEFRKIKEINTEEILDHNTFNIIKRSKIKKILFEIKIDVREDYFRILGAYIHMSINRLFYENQRFNEFKIYFFLYKKYQSIIAREKFKK